MRQRIKIMCGVSACIVSMLFLFMARREHAPARLNERTVAATPPAPQPLPEDHPSSPLLAQNFEPVTFPEKFMWGTATSAYQASGANPASDWWAWETGHDPTRLEELRDDYHMHRWYERDIEIARAIGLTQYRTSVEWSQIEPKEGQWDTREITHYRELFAALLKNNIEPVVCLNHFAIPAWLASKGGWENPQAPAYFARYAEQIAKHIGRPLGIRMWLTFNEPLVPVMNGYLKGDYPPGKINDWKGAETAFRNFVKAHKLAYSALHRICDTKRTRVRVGIAAVVSSFMPYTNAYADVYVSQGIAMLQNRYFFDATEDYHDFIGINYYKQYTLKLNSWSSFFLSEYVKEEMSAEGLYRVIKQFSVYQKPIIVTENGLNTADEKLRIQFIAAHLLAIHKAIAEGMQVLGYFHWSLTDTYEWNRGYTTHFGLVGINRKNQDRIVRKSAHFYANVIEQNGFDVGTVKTFLDSPEQ